jgi:iduronate 2-sulfatase
MTADHGWGLGEHNHWVKYTNFETDARVPLLVHHPRASHTWGVHTKSLIEHVDHYPTFAELAGVPVEAAAHESIEGWSYASLFSPNATPATTVWTSGYNASFTQYPRCHVTPLTPGGLPDYLKVRRCASVSKAAFDYMGYSMRTSRWRYTEWALWNGTTLKPHWALRVTAPDSLVELYDHGTDIGNNGPAIWDDFENVNVATSNPAIVTALSMQLRDFYADHRTKRGRPYTGW